MILWREMLTAFVLAVGGDHALAHDIYTGLHGKNGQLCCGGSDCSATIYREKAEEFEFLSRQRHWVRIPIDRITFLPVPGDEMPDDGEKRGHFCYREAQEGDRVGPSRENVFVSGDGLEEIFLYCAFIKPGGT